jgi:hypothetical protein
MQTFQVMIMEQRIMITRMVEIKENVVMNFVSIDSYYLHSFKKTI